ncbi:MAG: adenylate/guanylate cyclase domain-containing protein [Nitrospirota bacterium]|nr:adenylate/guanylate cyclase domain-containing protein [Nitrospirota bacterium]
MSDDMEREQKSAEDKAREMEEMLESRAKMDAAFQDKFTKVITVMFTDLKGSTALADKQGDIVSRLLVKHYQDIIIPAIKEHHGIFVKSIGDGTLSYFDNAQDALRAAVQLQRGIDAYILEHKQKTPILARAGMHTGRCIVEKSDIFGDVVNTASRFEGAADPGGIALSEDTLNALSNRNETYIKYVKTTTLKGKAEPFKVYKAFWNPDEAATVQLKDKTDSGPAAEKQKAASSRKLVIAVVIGILLLLALLAGGKLMNILQPSEEKRTIEDVSPAARQPAR